MEGLMALKPQKSYLFYLILFIEESLFSIIG